MSETTSERRNRKYVRGYPEGEEMGPFQVEEQYGRKPRGSNSRGLMGETMRRPA